MFLVLFFVFSFLSCAIWFVVVVDCFFLKICNPKKESNLKKRKKKEKKMSIFNVCILIVVVVFNCIFESSNGLTSCVTSYSCDGSTITDSIIDCLGTETCDSSTLSFSNYAQIAGFLAGTDSTITSSSSSGYVVCDSRQSCEYATITTQNGAIACRGFYSCQYGTLTSDSSINCQGYYGCYNTSIEANDTNCKGDNSCLYSSITAYDTLYVSGENAVGYGDVLNTAYIYDSGSNTFNYATISSSGLDRMEIISRGDHSTSESLILCYSGSTCVLRCQGDESCNGTTLICEDGASCRTFCYACATCPNISYTSSIDDDSLVSQFKNQRNAKIKQIQSEEPTTRLSVSHNNNNNNIKHFIDEKYDRNEIYIVIVIGIVFSFVLIAEVYQCMTNNNKKRKNLKQHEYHYQSINLA